MVKFHSLCTSAAADKRLINSTTYRRVIFDALTLDKTVTTRRIRVKCYNLCTSAAADKRLINRSVVYILYTN